MRYSILNRFRGTFLGAALGENLSLSSSAKSTHSSNWIKIAQVGAESLIDKGKLDLQDWHDRTTQINLQNNINLGAIIACLPVALTYHENLVKQRQNLQQVSKLFSNKSDIESTSLFLEDATIAIGYTLALCLTEKLNPHTLIPEIITYLKGSQTPFIQQLEQVQTLIEKRAGLEKVITQLKLNKLDNPPIALAFYCFLSTPEDFRLTILRTIRTNNQTQLTSAIAGMLSGAYNSIVGIPIEWRLKYQQTQELVEISDRLFAIWAGVIDPRKLEKNQLIGAIAAPRVIQPR